MAPVQTQIAIVGAGPAGMFLGHLLHAAGIAALVIERRDRAHVEGRVRAGVLERTTTDLLERLGLAARLRREGLVHGGTTLVSEGEPFRIDMAALTGGHVTVYGQQEVMRDLFDAAAGRDLPIVFAAADVALHGIDGDAPRVSWTAGGVRCEVRCDFVAGCDGFHGICRGALPAGSFEVFERAYPFGWLGILADVAPVSDELVYVNHHRGFALASMRSPTRSRYYLQCDLGTDPADWPDGRFWDELAVRVGPQLAAGLVRGPSFEKTVAPLRSFVVEPMRHGRLFLAGDAAHIVPPTGAKGLNLAVADVTVLARAFASFYRDGSEAALDGYSARALARVWKAERFSWWFTGITHRFPQMSGFERRMQVAELAYLRQSRAAQTALAENYVGLPLD